MGPRPFEIFQKISPSDSFWTLSDVQSAGFVASAAAAGPSPLWLVPWQGTQFCSITFLASPMPFSGFLVALASGGAFHSPCAWAHAVLAPAIATSTAAANIVFVLLPNARMVPPVGGSCWCSPPFNNARTNAVKAPVPPLTTREGSATPEAGEHLLHARRLHARPPCLSPTRALDLVQPQPVLVGQTARLPLANQSIDHLGRGRGRMEHEAIRE